ncbi:MAG: hypothetical protein KDC49_02530 [Saprospiraceae bacterium]|nr:hypothetical protein [Saprospiraceae bacterium]
MKSHLSTFVICFLFFVGGLFGQQSTTINVHSNAMQKDIPNVLVLPDDYQQNTAKTYPVLYLLHGYSGDQNSWTGIKKNLSQLATRYHMIIICPDGENSWYWDSPLNPSSKFETYVSKELVAYMDANYRTRPNPAGRAVTGLSMGGHGGMWLGIRNQDVFGGCGSMSGGVDILPFPENWEMKTQLGTLADNHDHWKDHTVINQVHKIKGGKLAIIIDCGTGDFFFEVNEALHEKLIYMNIPHDYIVRPGVHNGAYWENAIDYQILYFAKFFGTY